MSRLLRRLLAAGLLAAALSLVLLAGLAIASHMAGTAAAIEDGRELLGRLEASLVSRPPAEGAEGAPEPAPAEIFIEGPSEAIALAGLQSRLSALAESHGLRLQSATGLPARDEGPLRLIGLHIESSGAIESVLRLVHGLETERPVLILEAMRLSRTIAEGPARIDASMDVWAALAPMPAPASGG